MLPVAASLSCELAIFESIFWSTFGSILGTFSTLCPRRILSWSRSRRPDVDVSLFASRAESRGAPHESRVEGKSLRMESTSRAVPDLELPAAGPLLWPPALLESRDESLSRSCRFEGLEPMPDELPIPPGEFPIPDELLLWLLEGPNPPPPLWLLLEEELVELELPDGLGDAL